MLSLKAWPEQSKHRLSEDQWKQEQDTDTHWCVLFTLFDSLHIKIKAPVFNNTDIPSLPE